MGGFVSLVLCLFPPPTPYAHAPPSSRPFNPGGDKVPTWFLWKRGLEEAGAAIFSKLLPLSASMVLAAK